MKKKYIIVAACCFAIIAAFTFYYFFTPLNAEGKTAYIYIDNDDNIDSVINKIRPHSRAHAMKAYTTLVRHSHYAEHIRPGRYALDPHTSTFNTFRHIKNGIQEPLKLTIPSVRTMERLAAVIGKKLLADSAEISKAINDPNIQRDLGVNDTTFTAIIIPNTYDVYWNISPKKFLMRMKKEYDSFWNNERKSQAQALGLTKLQVATLASIIDEETANDQEKPAIARMYLNRLRIDMPLQADPTVKFALKDFTLKRIYNNMLTVKSPYNTYINTGLPPGPIRIPTLASLLAVLEPDQHDYLYMCAKEDLSGTHRFAKTYQEHLQNAKRYADALNKRGIK